ncbi:MAG: tetratricopeptide repeat protein [Steroidobacteraceae bacterium]
MDDLLTEGEQWEAVKAWARRNGVAVVAGLAIGALGLFGWRWWEARNERIALEAGTKYMDILETYDRGEILTATNLVDELKKAHPATAYVGPAELAAARMFVTTNELDKAADRLRNVMDTSKDEQLKLVARLRLARVQTSQGKSDDAIKTLGTLPEGSAFAARYAEARGDALLAKGDRDGALKEFLVARGAESFAPANGVAGANQLELKINDLKAGS